MELTCTLATSRAASIVTSAISAASAGCGPGERLGLEADLRDKTDAA
jgi:hypothetical protein